MIVRNALFFMMVSSLLLLPFSAARANEGAAAAGAAAEGAAAAAAHPEFENYQLSPLILPVITDKGLTQQISLVISIEMPYGEKDKVAPFGPRLADAYLQELYGTLGTGQDMKGGTFIDVQAVKARLTAVTTKIMGAGQFHDVLLQVVHQRSM